MSVKSMPPDPTNETPSQLSDQASDQAVQQARDMVLQLATSVSSLDRMRLAYLGCMLLVVVTTLVFDMAAFSVQTDYAVSETTAQVQRDAEAKLNSWSYTAFSSGFWGKLMWSAAAAGAGILVYGSVTASASPWIPLGQVACGGLCMMLMLLLLAVGFPDLSAYSDASSSATLLGYWVPMLAAAAATACAARPLLTS